MAEDTAHWTNAVTVSSQRMIYARLVVVASAGNCGKEKVGGAR